MQLSRIIEMEWSVVIKEHWNGMDSMLKECPELLALWGIHPGCKTH